MLVLNRKIGQKVWLNDTITITVVEIHGDRVRLGFDAPRDVKILREELRPRPQGGSGHASERA